MDRSTQISRTLQVNLSPLVSKSAQDQKCKISKEDFQGKIVFRVAIISKVAGDSEVIFLANLNPSYNIFRATAKLTQKLRWGG